MSSVVISGDTSGAITLSAPAVAGTNTLTLPASTGTIGLSGPAFGAYLGTLQVVGTSTYTKVAFSAENFDTNSCFNTSTYRFTPNVAGYYQLNSGIQIDSFSGYFNILIYKNGSQYSLINIGANATAYPSINISDIVYANGTTDYFEIYVYQNSGVNKNIYNGNAPSYCYFSGAMVRGA